MKLPVLHSITGEGLRARALRGSGWTFIGFGAQQVLRLASNLILTRLLFPEAFGLMALAQVFLVGLTMLSDIGVGPSIVQNKRGDDPNFLATAWTMQVVRGIFLFLVMCLLAYPASLIYSEPLLFPILICIGSTAIVQGFQSIGVSTASRKMALGKLTIIELLSQIAGIIVMVAWAWLQPSVWALAGGGVVAALANLLLGFKMLSSTGNRFHFEQKVAAEIFHFGKWIFIATTMTYLGGQGLRLVEGYLVPIDILGLLYIAAMLGGVAGALTHKVVGSVLFPAFAEINRERPEQLASRLKEARLKLFWITLPVFVLMIFFGRDLVTILYDVRYLKAGDFLVISATGAAIAAQRTPFGAMLIAVGDSYGHSIIMTVMTIARISAVVIGFHYAGVTGMLVADVMTNFVLYPFEVWRIKPFGLWSPGFDLMVFMPYAFLGILSYLAGPFVF